MTGGPPTGGPPDLSAPCRIAERTFGLLYKKAHGGPQACASRALDARGAGGIGSRTTVHEWSGGDPTATRGRQGRRSARGAATASYAPRRGRPGAPVRARDRGRAPLPRLDLAPRPPPTLPAATRADVARIVRSSPPGGRCTTRTPIRAGSCSGTVHAVGERLADPPARRADRHPRLADADAVRLDGGHRLDPTRRRSRSAARLRLRARAVGAMPDDLPLARRSSSSTSAPSRRSARARPATGPSACSAPGHAGKLALAARARAQAAARGRVDVDSRRVEPATALGLCDIGVAADLRDPLAALDGAPCRRSAGPADLTVVVVNAMGCEPAAILLTADDGTVCSSRWRRASRPPRWPRTGSAPSARMVVGSGYSPDRGATRSSSCAARPRCARRSASSRSPREPAHRCRCAGATSTRSATSTTRRPHLPRGGPRRIPRAARDRPRRVRGRPLLGRLPATRSIQARGRDRPVRGRASSAARA